MSHDAPSRSVSEIRWLHLSDRCIWKQVLLRGKVKQAFYVHIRGRQGSRPSLPHSDLRLGLHQRLEHEGLVRLSLQVKARVGKELPAQQRRSLVPKQSHLDSARGCVRHRIEDHAQHHPASPRRHNRVLCGNLDQG